MAYEISHFSCCRSPLPDLPPTHPSSFFWTFCPWKIVFSISCLLCGFFIVSVLLVTAVFILFSGLVCLSCYNSLFQDNCSFIDVVCG